MNLKIICQILLIMIKYNFFLYMNYIKNNLNIIYKYKLNITIFLFSLLFDKYDKIVYIKIILFIKICLIFILLAFLFIIL